MGINPTATWSMASGAIPSAVLKGMLDNGPILSSEAKARMAELGYSPKQIRAAREKLNVVSRRSGSGTLMRSTWSLPSPDMSLLESADSARDASVSGVAMSDQSSPKSLDPKGTNARQSECAPSEPALQDRTSPRLRVQSSDSAFVPPLTIEEESRIRRRAAHFVHQRGIDQNLATSIATLLVGRDRERSPEGSCVECQGFSMRKLCRALGPQEITVVWYCGSMRRDGP